MRETKGAAAASKKTSGAGLMSEDFVHLHNHTEHSLLDGLTKIPQLMEKVKMLGMQSVAMTDHGTLSGAIEFYKAAIGEGIKPIIGLEAYIAARKHTDKDPAKDKNRYHLILLAMNNVGYKNLLRLSTIAHLDGFYYYPRIDHDLLEQYSEGLIVLSGCMGSELGDALKNGQYDQASKLASWYKSVFGDRYYLEVQDHGHPENPKHSKEQGDINDQVLKLAEELDIKAVVTGDAHYLNEDDEEAHEILLCVGTGSFLADEKRMSLKDYPLFVEEPMKLIERWGKSKPDVISNTKEIADRCNLEIKLGEYLIPKFPVPHGYTENTYLVELTYQGLVARYGSEQSASKKISELKKLLKPEIVARAEYELGIIDRMGFNGYFLIVQDFINWGKNESIVFGPGRGSGAGSIVAFGLRITEIDPLEYDLLFERFLNPDRISMPDFDVDIQDTRRDEVIQYCVEKYGPDRVANIVTFGRMFARNAVRDVARVLQVPYAEADRLAKMIPPPVQGRHIPLARSLEENNDLKQVYEQNEDAKRVIDQAIRLEATIRSHGVHAAGVVIAPDDIVSFTPLEMSQKGVLTTQFSMGPIEDLGLLKMDFLGLSNLTIIKNALRIVKKVFNEDIEINQIPLDDKKTFELFQRGDTTGVFQFESAGMKRYLKELKPTLLDDLIAMNALYRPGPMQWISDFISRKHGLKKIEYLHPKMENALKNTYGVIVYQEQVMQISKDLCGFTGGQADTLRKGIGKKIPEVMEKMKEEFIEGAVKTSKADRRLMEKFWQQLEDFAAYCFNKAHAACYATIAYQTAYLKANYPEAFMAALMTSDFDNIDRLAIEIAECQHVGIEVLPPDINESYLEFGVVPGKKQIRFGLRAIKNVGSNAVEEIINVREEAGAFKSLEDFFGQVSARVVNRKTVESLIKGGAFDSFGDRLQLLENIDLLIAYGAKKQKEASAGQTGLFDGGGADTVAHSNLKLNPASGTYSERDQLTWERELLGLYLSKHPLNDFEEILKHRAKPINSFTSHSDGKQASVGGIINDIRVITTKNGSKMAFVKIVDLLSEMELIFFPKAYQQYQELLIRDKVVIVNGKISTKDRAGFASDEIKLMVDSINELSLDDAQNFDPSKVVPIAPIETKKAEPKIFLRIRSTSDQQTLVKLKTIFDDFPGEREVVLVVGDDKKQIIRVPNKINQEQAIDKLESVLGKSHIAIK